MTARLPLVADPDVGGLLRELLAEVRGLREDLRRSRETTAPALVDALGDYFGPSRFTVAGLFAIAEEEPHGALADALAASCDMNAGSRSRATQLGALLARMQSVEIVARQRGCAVYRMRTSGE